MDLVNKIFARINCKTITIAILIYILYFIIGSFFVFAAPKKVSADYLRNSDFHNYYSDEQGKDRAILLDNPMESGLARLFIIENAQKTLDVAYFSIEKGETPNIFFGALFDAADRGVKVNILLDGVFHGFRGPRRSLIYAISNHPNMNLKFYEKFNPLLPWTINNRMHDKYIIADNKVSIIGGRNIGDKYFAPESYKKSVTNDRDVMIINSGDKENESAVNQMSQYFNEIWSHKYSKDVHLWTKSIFRRKANEVADDMREQADIWRVKYDEKFEDFSDIYSKSIPTNKITFIHNPIERFSKEPWCWYEIVQLFKGAKKSVFIQSPYVIPAKKMTNDFLTTEDITNKDITILTNSLASTPNLIAFSGYQNYREKIVDHGVNILEIQSEDSLHSKAFVIDKDIVAIGSFNLDARSAFLSTESMVVIHSEELVEKFANNVFNYTDESLLVDEDYKYKENINVKEKEVPLIKRIIVNILSIPMRLGDFLL